jgi:hypothetical protein
MVGCELRVCLYFGCIFTSKLPARNTNFFDSIFLLTFFKLLEKRLRPELIPWLVAAPSSRQNHAKLAIAGARGNEFFKF